MASYLILDDIGSLTAKINDRAADTFHALPERSELEVYKHLRRRNEETNEIVCVVKNQDVKNVAQIKALQRESKDSSQFFFIRQERSWTTLNISRELIEDLLLIYGVFSPFWKAIFTFGRKSRENEHTFPVFRARRSFLSKTDGSVSHESAYVLRRVELNHRELTEGQSPWSIRQTAVYHKSTVAANSEQSSSTFIIIAPSKKLEQQLSESLEMSKVDARAIASCNVHRLLVADSMGGWMDYMAWVEETLNEQSNLIIWAKVGAEKESLSPLLDLKFNFVDRQKLKVIEDAVVNLQVILPTLLANITAIREQCSKHYETLPGAKWVTSDCGAIMAEFDQYAREIECCIQRTDSLREKVKSTTQLLSDLLSYEDAITLEKIAKESQNESRSMTILTGKSTKDAAAVKFLTIISLVYLPSTIVANFFSTQFVHTDDVGNMAVDGSAWVLAAISIPLTIFTIGCWWVWVRYANYLHPATPELAPVVKIVRYGSFRSLRSSRRRQQPSDEESGIGTSPGTWSTATTTKSQ